jgi:hypothetical protein
VAQLARAAETGLSRAPSISLAEGGLAFPLRQASPPPRNIHIDQISTEFAEHYCARIGRHLLGVGVADVREWMGNGRGVALLSIAVC